jgi:hypothetical protein
MKYKWPIITVAALFNAILITAAFLEFKSRSVYSEQASQSMFTFLKIHPLLVAAGAFAFTFTTVVLVVVVSQLCTGIITKMVSFNKSLANPQLELPNSVLSSEF